MSSTGISGVHSEDWKGIDRWQRPQLSNSFVHVICVGLAVSHLELRGISGLQRGNGYFGNRLFDLFVEVVDQGLSSMSQHVIGGFQVANSLGL